MKHELSLGRPHRGERKLIISLREKPRSRNMSKIWQAICVAVVGLGLGVAVVGCTKSPGTEDKMKDGKTSTDKMKGDKMEADKMATDKMKGDKMAADKMAADKMKGDKMEADKMEKK
jgi:pentapeptide MXKDX repeat protein